ncbi:MAG: hypothetical protein CVU77_06100 [Elusimicrobia bacterium HGW-Elusimicrobia-1]|jgi:hypothetical protein|nr:MAG: hypothetical protein CVU79_08315 [Elusimicrobia bacterium HGW-Elusimicrobia-3]PKN01251.1 MAG: hypothetical protein CVU77_06100 [Elusimicrobia bacterium HGW-Elusimicrobia-1]
MANNEYIRQQKTKFEDYAERYRAEANEVFRELVRQLILTATVLVTLGPYVLSRTEVTKFTVLDKYLFMFAMVLIAISIPMGIVQLVVDHYFFRAWHRAKYSVVEGIARKEITDDNIWERSVEKQSLIQAESNTIFVWLQLIFVIVGLMLLLVQLCKGILIA